MLFISKNICLIQYDMKVNKTNTYIIYNLIIIIFLEYIIIFKINIFLTFSTVEYKINICKHKLFHNIFHNSIIFKYILKHYNILKFVREITHKNT